jgi:hypothetical protein
MIKARTWAGHVVRMGGKEKEMHKGFGGNARKKRDHHVD